MLLHHRYKDRVTMTRSTYLPSTTTSREGIVVEAVWSKPRKHTHTQEPLSVVPNCGGRLQAYPKQTNSCRETCVVCTIL